MRPIQEQQQSQTLREPFEHLPVQIDQPSEATTSARAPGKFPKLATTLRAGVLATLLAGEEVPGMEIAFANGSTKLATVMRALTRRYRWPIERTEFATKTADGRAAWVSMYTLPAEVVASAFDHGAAAWIEEVHTSRSLRLARPTSAIAGFANATEMKCTTTGN
jgi:hypothetical protein